MKPNCQNSRTIALVHVRHIHAFCTRAVALPAPVRARVRIGAWRRRRTGGDNGAQQLEVIRAGAD